MFALQLDSMYLKLFYILIQQWSVTIPCTDQGWLTVCLYNLKGLDGLAITVLKWIVMKKIDLYSADGYKCSKTCMDFDQPAKVERKTNIKHYFPKSTICPFDQTCCRNTEIKTTPCGKVMVFSWTFINSFLTYHIDLSSSDSFYITTLTACTTL